MDTPSDTKATSEVQSLFIDGFEMQLNNAGFLVPLKVGDKPVLILRLPFVTAKSLSKSLDLVLKALEEKVGTILDTKEMNDALKEVSDKLIEDEKMKLAADATRPG